MSYVFIAECRDLSEARVIISYLEAHGFHPRASQEKTREIAPHLAQLMGKLSIEIPENEAIEASLALEELETKRQEIIKNSPLNSREQEYERLLSESQEVAKKSFYCSILGAVLLPILMNFYSLKLAYRVMKTESPVSQKSWRFLLAAGFFNSISFYFWFNFGSRWLLNLLK